MSTPNASFKGTGQDDQGVAAGHQHGHTGAQPGARAQLHGHSLHGFLAAPSAHSHQHGHGATQPTQAHGHVQSHTSTSHGHR